MARLAYFAILIWGQTLRKWILRACDWELMPPLHLLQTGRGEEKEDRVR